MTSTIARPDRGITAPGPLLYLTEPARAAVDFGLLTASAPLLAALPRGDGHPVLVLPRLGGTDSASTITLRAVLRRLGYRPQRAVHGTRARLDQLTSRFGQPVSVIGWSLGGIYARQLARRTVHAVRQVITLGSPIRRARKGQSHANRLIGDYSHWHIETWDLPLEHGHGPLPVPTTSIYSPLDGILAWRTGVNEPAPQAENIAVSDSHLGFGHHRAVIWAIADRLAQPAGQWALFRPPPLLRPAHLLGERQP